MLHRILFNQHLSGGGGETIVTPDVKMPAGNLKPSASSGKPHPEIKDIPEDVKSLEFKADDELLAEFEVEQLPEQKSQKENVAEVIGDKKEKVEKPEEVKSTEEEITEEVINEKKEEKTTEPGLPKFLKPPKSDKDSKKDESKLKSEETIKPLIPIGKVTRDYTGHSAEEVAAFKKMSDEGYTLTKRLINENKELSKLKDSTYLQHENAYILDPAFQELRTTETFAKKEGDYWQEQLLLMKSGKPWKPITAWDKEGNPVLGAERQPNERDEEQVRVMMNNCYAETHRLNGQIRTYPDKYKQQMTADMQAIEAESLKRFDWVREPKLMDYSIEIAGFGDRTIKQITEDFTGLFPPYMRGNPGVKVAANLFVALRLQEAQIQELQNNKVVEDIKTEEVTRVEPTTSSRPAKPKKAVNGVTEFSSLPADF